MKAWQPIMTPLKVVIIFVCIGVSFIPTGVTLLKISNDVYEKKVMYDGSNQAVDCSITEKNQGRKCKIDFTFDEAVSGPLYVYYELENFYQNHRRYVSSRDPNQLYGEYQPNSLLKTTCQVAYRNKTKTINPCGLIANSLFTDIITLDTNSTITLDSSDISWETDDGKYKQPDGFVKGKVSDYPQKTCSQALGVNDEAGCKTYKDPTSGENYYFYYPRWAETQYLYETYPDQISPLDGVDDKHFRVWMRPAALPQFRKLYGKIDSDFEKGDQLSFKLVANYEVSSFDGSKSIVISTLGEFGGRNPYLGVAYIVVGSVSLLFALLFIAKQTISPRDIANPSLLNWN